MKFQALMVSVEDAAADLLAQIFDDLRLDHERCSLAQALPKFEETRIDFLAIGFDDAAAGENLIQALRRSSLSKTAVTLGLVSDPAKVTQAFGAGANFVLHQPLSPDNARATLRAAAALLQRERRRQFRVPVQLAVTLSCAAAPELEGIMLDLSEGGMDVLAAKALQPGQFIDVRFCLPPATDMLAHAQVVWANSNGQSGLQFVTFAEVQSRALSSWLGTNAPQSPPDDPEPLSEYKLSDLSLGGCYIETLAPFPKHTRIDVCLRVSDFEIHLDGTVRLVYPGHGMGVEFTPTPEQRDLVLSLIGRLSTHAGVTPDVLVWPKALNFKDGISPEVVVRRDENDDTLLQLLAANTSLSQDEFLAELRRQRVSQPEVTTA
jgi:DNA-binding response OmpR family regulator